MEYHKSQSFKIFQSYIDCLNLGYSYSPQQGYAIWEANKSKRTIPLKKNRTVVIVTIFIDDQIK